MSVGVRVCVCVYTVTILKTPARSHCGIKSRDRHDLICPLKIWLWLLCRGWTVGGQSQGQQLGDLQISR